MEKVALKNKSPSAAPDSQFIDSNSVRTPAVAVKLKNVSMAYKLYNNPKDRLKEALHPFRRKYHRDFYALKNINLEVRRGEILGIVGKNGSGKSTLLKIISNIIQPTSGTVQVNGAVSAILELGGGFNPDFTGIENIYFYGSILGFTRKEMEARIGEIIEFADIGDFIEQPIKTYSSGMIARLAFAVSTAVDPEILVLDEVLAVGDELFKRKCYARMEKFVERGKTIFFVSHSVDAINQMCTRAILLDKGELILEGPPKLVTSYYQKLLFAKKENAEKVRREIIELNQNGEKKKAFQREHPKRKEIISRDEKEKDVLTQKPFYIPDLKPKSTVRYKNYDVDIYDIHIQTLNGQKVNVLVIGEDYIYCYRVKFNIDVEKVIFGMQIKNMKGVMIEGASEPGLPEQNRYLPVVKKGEEYLVKWYFRCLLMPGLYFTNSGVSGYINGKIEFLHRITDAIAFKVQDVPDKNYSGLVHIYYKNEIILVDNSNKEFI